MPTWKKVIVSGSQAHLQGITASNIPSASNVNVLLYNSESGQFTYLSTSSIGNISGTGTQNFITRWSSGTTITTSSIYESGSRIGIGVGAVLPNAVLHISGANNNGLLEVDSVSKNNILFVSGSGLVGIGTGTPQADLHISTSQGINDTAFLVHGTNKDSASFAVSNGGGTTIINQNADATLFLRNITNASPGGILIRNNSTGGTEGGIVYIPAGFGTLNNPLTPANPGVADSILVYATRSLHLYSDGAANSNSGSLQSIRFSLGTSGSSTPLTRMIITSSGATTRVGIGDFWQTNSSQPLYPQNTLEVRGGITVTNITASNIPSASNAHILLYNSASGRFTYLSTSSLVSTNAFVQGGNSFGATAVLGTNDNNNLQFETNGSARITIISSSGNVGIGTAAPTAQLQTTEDIIVNGVNIGNGGGDQTTNTRVGFAALAANNSNITAQRNTAVGYLALNTNTDGADNTALGYQALQANATGILNTALGSSNLQVSTASENTAVGANVLVSNLGGASNTAVGAGALYENVNGSGNTAVGVTAGRFLSNGSSANTNSNTSIFIGGLTKASGSNGSNEIVIGYDAVGAGNNSVVLGNTNITKTLLRAGVGIGLSNVQTPSNTLQVAGGITVTNITASNIPSASNANVLLYNSESGQFTYLSTSSLGNVQGSGADTQVTFWTGPNTIAGDAGLTYNSLNDSLTVGGNVTLGGDLRVDGGDINVPGGTTTATLFETNAVTINIGGVATSVNIGHSSGTGTTTVRNNLAVNGNATITGDLTVNGTTTTIDTTNLTVEDKFIILAHGSGSISPIAEGGIIVEGSTADKGQAFLFNSGSTAGVTGRWGLAADVHATSSNVTPTDFMVSVERAAGAPSSNPTYGGLNGGWGNMYVNSNDDSIWIFS